MSKRLRIFPPSPENHLTARPDPLGRAGDAETGTDHPARPFPTNTSQQLPAPVTHWVQANTWLQDPRALGRCVGSRLVPSL